MLEIKGLKKAFGSLEVLKGVDLKVNQGDVVAILGPSGSGKTTMLRCVNFLEHADGGSLIFDGKVVHLYKDTVRLPDGAESVREYVKHVGAVCILPLTDDGEVISQHQQKRHRGDPSENRICISEL